MNSEANAVENKIPPGLPGWVIVSVFIISLTIFGGLYFLFSMLSGENIAAIKGMISENDPMLNDFLISYFGYSSCLVMTILSAVVCLILIFRKSRKTPFMILAHYLMAFATSIFSFWNAWEVYLFDTTSPMGPDYSYKIVQAFVFLLAWGYYYFFSKRAKETFVY